MALSKAQRLVLHAMFGGHCAYCGCDLPEKWHADHVEPVYREWWKRLRPKTRSEFVDGKWISIEIDRKVTMSFPERDVLENHFPACPPCNIDKSARPLEVWRKSIEQRVEVCRRNYSAYRHAERFGMVAQVKTTLVFYFEKQQAEERNEQDA